MARPSTGALTLKEAQSVEMKWLLENNCRVKNARTKFSLAWNQGRENTGSAGFTFLYTEKSKKLELSYKIGEINYSYEVNIEAVPANIGAGEILFFVCPETGRKCRALYRAYNYPYFISQYAYIKKGFRLYYPCQQSGRCDKYNDRYWRLEKKLQANQKKRKAGNYKGNPTKRKIWSGKILAKQWEADELRWTKGLPKCLQGAKF